MGAEGWDATPWTEYDCTTGDGRYLAVVFAPSAITNRPGAQSTSAFGAVVDTTTGARWVLPYRVALSYHTPGCGVGDRIAFTRSAPSTALTSPTSTDVFTVDATTSSVVDTRHYADEVTSVRPTPDGGLVGVVGTSLVSLPAHGSPVALARETGPLYGVHPTAGGGVQYLVKDSQATAVAKQWSAGRQPVTLAHGPLHNLQLAGGRAGVNHLIGAPTLTAAAGRALDIVRTATTPLAASLDASVLVNSTVPATSSPTSASTTGPSTAGLVVRPRAGGAQVTVGLMQDSNAPSSTTAPSTPTGTANRPASRVPAVTQAPLVARSASGATATQGSAAAATSPCAVPLLDPGTQIIQPSSAQIERAVNLAVLNSLGDPRPGNWQKHGLPAYAPQTLFPTPALVGGGHVPVQVVEGILAQESNFAQASPHALPGVAGDPLVGNFYGTVYDSTGHITSSNYANADCGYGLGQITQHMRSSDTTWSSDLKREVATDYEVNVAATVSILSQAWNQLHSSPENIIANGGDTAYVENWYFALWAYNSGIQPTSSYGNTSGCVPGPSCTYNGRWGLGWTNNPAQNAYPPNRQPFLTSSYDDAAHPGNWPYQEKVLGWAQRAQLSLTDGKPKYAATAAALKLPTDYYLFCTSANNCSKTSSSTGFCLSSDRSTCWWHNPATWNAGAGTTETVVAPAVGEPVVADPYPYPASCSTTASPVVQTPGVAALPPGAVVVDELASSATNQAGCTTTASAGSFNLSYGTDSNGNPNAAIDTHQLGVGYMGHTYFAHTVDPTRTNVVATGTWTPPSTVVGWQRIWVHIPDNGADTFQADYKINTGAGSFHRVVNQRWNKNTWFDLGSFQLAGGATVTLSNGTLSDWGVGAIDLSWDALAFTPSTKPAVSSVAFGDSYQAGEGVEPYYANADNGGGGAHTDSCHRSPQAYGPLVFSDLAAAHPGNDEFHFVACSGAVINDVSGGGQHSGEVPQLNSGWLDVNTTNVTIGVGGNDARFAAIIKGCLLTITACTSPDYRLTVDGKVDPEALITYEPKVIDGLQQGLANTYAAVKSAAPNAQITVVAYPHVVTPADRRSGLDCGSFDQPTVNFFAQMTDRLAGVIAAAASSAGVRSVNPVAAFTGHEACVPSTSDEWINAVVFSSSSGSGSSNPGSGSFHPKSSGHQALRPLVRATFS